jgi:hypothetical protein
MSQLLAQYPAAIRSLAQLLRHPRHQAFVVALVVIVTVGVVFYSVTEGWSIIDSFYFTVIALSTIGFGDLVPSSEASRLFTALYALVGVGVIGTAVHLLVINARAVAEQARGGRDAAQPTTGGDPG